MNLITFIRALKASGRIVAYNLEHNTLPVTYHLRKVRQVTTRYLIDDNGRPYSEFIYAPYPVVINPSIRDADEVPTVPEPLTERKELAPVDVSITISNETLAEIPIVVLWAEAPETWVTRLWVKNKDWRGVQSQKPSSGEWRVLRYSSNGWFQLEYPVKWRTITVSLDRICTPKQYQQWLDSLNTTENSERKAA